MNILSKLYGILFKKVNSKIHDLENVFTPSYAATLTYIKRTSLEKQINRALLMPGIQIVVYGHSGSGKTTLVQNILNENKRNFIFTNCILDTTIDQLILNAFDQLEPFVTTEASIKKTSKLGSKFKSNLIQVQTTIKSELKSEQSHKQERILPAQITPQRLAELLGKTDVIWIIEDFHKVNSFERNKLSQIIKIFVDLSNKYKRIKIITIGASGSARDIVNYNPELNNRISEINVPLLHKSELESLIIKGENLLNVKFPVIMHDRIIKFSNSLASICHHLCYSICFNNNILHTSKNQIVFEIYELQNAIGDYLSQNADSFKEVIDRALKPRETNLDNTSELLKTICKADRDELTQKEILHLIPSRNHFKKNLDSYLGNLTTPEYGEILKFDENSGKYSFTNPFYKAYAAMYFLIDDSDEGAKISEDEKFESIFDQLKWTLSKIDYAEATSIIPIEYDRLHVPKKIMPKNLSNRYARKKRIK